MAGDWGLVWVKVSWPITFFCWHLQLFDVFNRYVQTNCLVHCRQLTSFRKEKEAMSTEQTASAQPVPVVKAPVKAMWICMILSWFFFLIPIPGTIFLAAPLALAAFILAILCLSRNRVGQGVFGLIGSTVIAGITYLIGFSLMAHGISATSQLRRDRDATAVVNATDVIKVTASQLVADYSANEVAADGKYKGKVLEVNGVISSIGKDITDRPYISFTSNNPGSFRGVQCIFEKNQEEQLVTLAKGESISVRGMCDGLMGNVLIKGSQLVQ